MPVAIFVGLKARQAGGHRVRLVRPMRNALARSAPVTRPKFCPIAHSARAHSSIRRHRYPVRGRALLTCSGRLFRESMHGNPDAGKVRPDRPVSKPSPRVSAMPTPEAFLTWLFLPWHFACGWMNAGADLMTGARA